MERLLWGMMVVRLRHKGQDSGKYGNHPASAFAVDYMAMAGRRTQNLVVYKGLRSSRIQYQTLDADCVSTHITRQTETFAARNYFDCAKQGYQPVS